MPKDILKDKKLLTRFIWKLRFLPDTPALIQFVAGEEDYMLLCSRIVNAAADDAQDFQLIEDICLKQQLDFQALKQRLTPVARAFGLARGESDYYELMGVSRDADTAEIKKAFREKVLQVHPDTGGQISDEGQEFINLKRAYQILRDPLMRQQYDQSLPDVNLWREKADHVRRLPRLAPPISQDPNQKPFTRTQFFFQLGGLFLLLIIAVFVFDFLYQQNAIFAGSHPSRPERVIKPKTQIEDVKQDSDGNTGQKSTKLKPNRSDDSRKISNPDDLSKEAARATDVKLLMRP